MHTIPSILTSCMTFFLCIFFITVMNRLFKFPGLCCYLVITSTISNIQLLYTTYYEIINMHVVLGTVPFCSSFLACDIINKVYGKSNAKMAIWIVIFCDILLLFSMLTAIWHKPCITDLESQENIFAIKKIFLQTPRFLISSYITYFVSQRIEIYLFDMAKKIKFIKSKFIKHNITLFISSVIIDTFVFTFLAFYLMSPITFTFDVLNDIFWSAIIVRLICNIGNTAVFNIIYNKSNIQTGKSI